MERVFISIPRKYFEDSGAAMGTLYDADKLERVGFCHLEHLIACGDICIIRQPTPEETLLFDEALVKLVGADRVETVALQADILPAETNVEGPEHV